LIFSEKFCLTFLPEASDMCPLSPLIRYSIVTRRRGANGCAMAVRSVAKVLGEEHITALAAHQTTFEVLALRNYALLVDRMR
jgi:hypothetical protein